MTGHHPPGKVRAVRFLRYALLLEVGSITLQQSAHAQAILVRNGGPYSTLYNINLSTGSTSSPRDVKHGGYPVGLIGISRSPSGVLYGVSGSSTAAPYGSDAFRIFIVNPTTGSLALQPKLHQNGQVYGVGDGDIAFDPTTGVLYGFSNGTLFTVDVNSGSVSQKGGISSSIQSMAFHSSGSLFMLNPATGQLLRVNKSNGGTMASIPVSIGLCSPISAMRFSGNDLYVVNSDRLYKVAFIGPVASATTVTTTVVGNTSNYISGMSF